MWGSRCEVLVLSVGLSLAGACADDGAPERDDSTSSETGGSTGTSGTTTTAATTGGSTSGSDTEDATGSTGEAPPETVAECWEGEFAGVPPLPNYDQFGVQPGSHCQGSNHQDIMDVERVVFLGDSVTVGTPPATSAAYYRNLLADSLVDRFALDTGDDFAQWKGISVGGGTSGIMNSGAFWSCAEFGARNDDFLGEGNQLELCFPEETRDDKTLVIMTMGGNDLKSYSQDLAEGIPFEDVWAEMEQALLDKRATLDWLTDPAVFPNGNHVVFSNVYEFTDATADFLACPLAATAGFDTPLDDPTNALLIVAHIEEEYGKMAAETGTDFIFMFEHFCGHGFRSDDPTSLCYRGPGNETWFDLTCIHPNSIGHGVIADMFLATIDE